MITEESIATIKLKPESDIDFGSDVRLFKCPTDLADSASQKTMFLSQPAVIN